MARILRLPSTPAGRALLCDVLATIRSADTRMFVVEEFDWDESAIEDQRQLELTSNREAL